MRHIARANAYGQILLGLDRPAADVSRGSNAHDILGVAAIVGVQSIDYDKLYPGAGEKLPGETEFISLKPEARSPQPPPHTKMNSALSFNPAT